MNGCLSGLSRGRNSRYKSLEQLHPQGHQSRVGVRISTSVIYQKFSFITLLFGK